MSQNKQYDHQFKVQAVKLAQEIGAAKPSTHIGSQ